MNEVKELMSSEKREDWIKNKIEYLADVFTESFLFYALTPFTKDRPKDMTLKDFLTIVFSTDNELKDNIARHMRRAGISENEIDEIFALFEVNRNENNIGAGRRETSPELKGHNHIYGDLELGTD